MAGGRWRGILEYKGKWSHWWTHESCQGQSRGHSETSDCRMLFPSLWFLTNKLIFPTWPNLASAVNQDAAFSLANGSRGFQTTIATMAARKVCLKPCNPKMYYICRSLRKMSLFPAILTSGKKCFSPFPFDSVKYLKFSTHRFQYLYWCLSLLL